MGGMTRAVASRVREPSKPQWSLPLMGGMTAVMLGCGNYAYQPQWSPPLTGGMTARKTRAI